MKPQTIESMTPEEAREILRRSHEEHIGRIPRKESKELSERELTRMSTMSIAKRKNRFIILPFLCFLAGITYASLVLNCLTPFELSKKYLSRINFEARREKAKIREWFEDSFPHSMSDPLPDTIEAAYAAWVEKYPKANERENRDWFRYIFWGGTAIILTIICWEMSKNLWRGLFRCQVCGKKMEEKGSVCPACAIRIKVNSYREK